jgi:hypothetical protein
VQEALDLHARKFPHGALAPDREYIRSKLPELGGDPRSGGADKAAPLDGERGIDRPRRF